MATDTKFNSIILTKVLPNINEAFCNLFNEYSGSRISVDKDDELMETLFEMKAETTKKILNDYIDAQIELFNSNRNNQG